MTANVNDPRSFASHRQRMYPSTAGQGLPMAPDRITLDVHLQAIGDDVLKDLEISGDLDSDVAAKVAKYTIAGAHLEWTSAQATAEVDPATGVPKLCMTTGNYNASVTPAATHVRCQP